MGFENVCKSLNAYFSNSKVFAPLQLFAMPITLVCAALMILENFISFSGFGHVVLIAFWLFFFMLLGTENYLMIAIALGIRAVDYLIPFLRGIFKYHSFYWYYVLYIAIFGYLAYVSYMRSVKSTN